MTAPSTKDIVDRFTQQVTERLETSQLDGPVRLDNTHTVVIIPLKDRGPIHARIQGNVNDDAVDNIIAQLQIVPSLKGIVKSE